MKSKKGYISFTRDKLLQRKMLRWQNNVILLIGIEIPPKHLKFLSFHTLNKYMMKSCDYFFFISTSLRLQFSNASFTIEGRVHVMPTVEINISHSLFPPDNEEINVSQILRYWDWWNICILKFPPFRFLRVSIAFTIKFKLLLDSIMSCPKHC